MKQYVIENNKTKMKQTIVAKITKDRKWKLWNSKTGTTVKYTYLKDISGYFFLISVDYQGHSEDYREVREFLKENGFSIIKQK